MKIRPLLENYKLLDLRILVCEKEIKERKRELLPSMTSQAEAGGFSGNFTGSPTEKTVIKFQNDKTIQYWQQKKERAEEEKEFVEKIIASLKQPERMYFEKRFVDGFTVARVAEECNVTTQHLYNVYSRTISRIEKLGEPAEA